MASVNMCLINLKSLGSLLVQAANGMASESTPSPPPRRARPQTTQRTVWPTADELVSEVLPGRLLLGPYMDARTPGFAAFGGVASQVNCDPDLDLVFPELPAVRVAIEDRSPPVANIIELMTQVGCRLNTGAPAASASCAAETLNGAANRMLRGRAFRCWHHPRS